jgi:hypothetical protein
MKTPREILLARHRAIEPKLDVIRREAVTVAADVNRRKTPVGEWAIAAALANVIRVAIRELVWPCRRIWAGLAAVWMILFAVNFSMRDHSPAVAGKSPPTTETIMAWRQQERLLAELIGPPGPSETEPPKTFLPKPRTENAAILTV